MDGRTEKAVIKKTWVSTAAGASVRESALEDKTPVMFGMVCGWAPVCYAEHEAQNGKEEVCREAVVAVSEGKRERRKIETKQREPQRSSIFLSLFFLFFSLSRAWIM